MLKQKIADYANRVRSGLRKQLKDSGFDEHVSERQIDLAFAPVYKYLNELQTRPSRLPFRKRALGLLRHTVAEAEFLLVPNHAAAFELLGVSVDATPRVVKERYRELARTHHPDKTRDDGVSMQNINRAYEVVTRIVGES